MHSNNFSIFVRYRITNCIVFIIRCDVVFTEKMAYLSFAEFL